MTDDAPVSHDAPAPEQAAVKLVKRRFDQLSGKTSTLLSHAVMVGMLALVGAACYERPTSRGAVAAAPLNTPAFAAVSANPAAAMPDVRSRPVTTLRISAGPKRETAETPPLEAAPVLSPQTIVAQKSAMVPPIKRVVPVTPPLPSSVAVVPPLKVAEAPAPKSAETPADASSPTKPEAAPDNPPALETVEPVDSSGWPEVEVATALRQCTAMLADRNVQFEHANPVRQGNCGTPAPIKLKAIGKPEVSLANPALMNCAVAVAVGNWVDRVLQPAAKEIFSSPVVRLVGTGSYTCRNRNGAADGPISEHAFGNAFDVSGFVLADGRTINVLGGWGRAARDDAMAAKVAAKVTPAAKPPLAPDSRSALKGPPIVTVAQPAQVASAPAVETKPEVTSDAKFLRRIHGEACKLFGTVLGPEANDAHRDHLHFDLKERKGKAYCQ